MESSGKGSAPLQHPSGRMVEGPGFTPLEWLRKIHHPQPTSPAPHPREKGMTGASPYCGTGSSRQSQGATGAPGLVSAGAPRT